MSEDKMTEAATNATPLDDASGISASAEQALSVITTELQTLNEEKEALERELQEVITLIHTRAVTCKPPLAHPTFLITILIHIPALI